MELSHFYRRRFRHRLRKRCFRCSRWGHISRCCNAQKSHVCAAPTIQQQRVLQQVHLVSVHKFCVLIVPFAPVHRSPAVDSSTLDPEAPAFIPSQVPEADPILTPQDISSEEAVLTELKNEPSPAQTRRAGLRPRAGLRKPDCFQAGAATVNYLRALVGRSKLSRQPFFPAELFDREEEQET